MGHSNRRQMWFRQFIRVSTGSTAVEYAVCLGLIVGTVLAAGFFIGTPTRSAFSNPATALQSSLAAPTDGNVAGAPNEQARPDRGPVPPVRGAVEFWLSIVAVGSVAFIAAQCLARRRTVRMALREQPHDELVAAPVPPELQARFVEKRRQIFSYLSAEARIIAKGGMTVRNIMSTPPVRRSPHDKVEGLRDLMKEQEFHHLVVCTPDDKVVGVISDRDVLGRPGALVSDIMTPNPATVTPETPLGMIISMFLAKRISCVPVVEHERLCGIITSTDILMLLQCVLRLLEQLALPVEPHVDLHPQIDDTPQDEAEPELVGSR